MGGGVAMNPRIVWWSDGLKVGALDQGENMGAGGGGGWRARLHLYGSCQTSMSLIETPSSRVLPYGK